MSTYKLSLCYEKEQKEGGEGVGNNEEKEVRMAERRNEIWKSWETMAWKD